METPASSIDLARNMDWKYRVVGGVASEMGSLFFVFMRKATVFSECQVQWPVEREEEDAGAGKRIEKLRPGL